MNATELNTMMNDSSFQFDKNDEERGSPDALNQKYDSHSPFGGAKKIPL
jgi:hypothetical protein